MREEFDGQLRRRLSCLDTKTKGLFGGATVGLSELRTLYHLSGMVVVPSYCLAKVGRMIEDYLQNVHLQQLERQNWI